MSYGADRSYFLVVVKHVLPHNGGPVECAGDVHYTEGEDERRSKVNGQSTTACFLSAGWADIQHRYPMNNHLTSPRLH